MIDNYLASEPREYVRMEFELRHRRSPAYSLRAFARDLKMSPSSLSEFLQGKLGLSHQRVDRLAEMIRLSEQQRVHWHDLMNARWARDPVSKKQAQLRVQSRVRNHPGRLDLEKFKVVADWYHFAILSALEVGSAFQKPSRLAKALRLRVGTVQDALKRLVHTGLLVEDNGTYKPSSSSSFAGDETPDEAVRESHRQVLKLAERALLEQDISTRESCSIFLPVDSAKLNECRNELRKATLDILTKYSQMGRADTVAGFTMHLFNVCTQPQEVEQ